jgi:thiol:disulfide interchange protein DsbD
VLGFELDWGGSAPSTTPTTVKGSKGIAWQAWSPEAVDAARKEGKIVFVDFTAKWCVTCQVNKKTSIEIESVEKRLKELGAVALLGDFTRQDERIGMELQKFNRAGVPLVLVYPKDASKPPIVLPEVLTPGIVLDALEQAAK